MRNKIEIDLIVTSAEIKNDLIILEEKLKNLMESGDMTVNEFVRKSGASYPWVCDWKNGKLKKNKTGKPRHASYEKILDMASKLEM